MKHVRLIRKDENAVSPVIATILMVAITVVLAAVLYVMVSGLLVGPGTGPQTMGVIVRQAGTNWSVEIQTVPSAKLPATTYLLIRDPQGVISLARTPWTSLTPANWGANKAFYQDANPSTAEIRPGDSLLIDRATYPSGSTLEISDDAGVLANQRLQ